MPSLGEQNIILAGRCIGAFRVTGLRAASALQPRVLLSAECVLRVLPAGPASSMPALEDYSLLDLTGELLFGSDSGPSVTDLHWLDKDRRVQAMPFESATEVTLAGDIDCHRLARIEQLRNGGVPTLGVRLWPTLVGAGEPMQGRIPPIQFKLPREMWLEFLSASKFSDMSVVELPVPSGLSSRFRGAVDQLAEAQRELTVGNYNQVALACRKAMEVIREDSVDDSSHSRLQQVIARSVGENRAKAYVGMVRQLKQVTASSAHAYDRQHPYCRAEALYLVRCTVAFLAMLGDLPIDQQQLASVPEQP